MTEEEIIKQIKNDKNVGEFYGITEDAIQGLLELYNKQKEEIKELKQGIEELKEINSSLLWQRNNIDIPKLEDFNNHYISKDKIREYVNSPEFLDWHLGFTQLDELEYRKNNINKLLEE